MEFLDIRLETNDLAMIKSFYQGQLNLRIIEEKEGSITFEIGQTSLTFEKSDLENPVYHYAINIPKNQFAEACNWLRERVKTIIYEGSDEVDFENWNANSIYFYDSVGNIGELIARHDLQNATEIPFSEKSLLNISEIGLPTTNVPKLTNLLKQKLGLKTYVSGGETFNPLGTEKALFICVIEDRDWFPTTVKSKEFPVMITLKSDNKLDFEFGNYQFKS
jgi:catechol-2,3-dioxygenase